MIPAKGYVKNYLWGKIGQDSYIAKFEAVAAKFSAPNDKEKNQQQEHLAELWFGSHPSGPSKVSIGNQLVNIDEFLTLKPEMMGLVDHYFKFNRQLPFLFKILSIAQPLSLQAHPDKELAQVLHKRDPKNYPDSNHKPELAIALTDFHVLCDFRPHIDIARFIKSVASFKQIIGETTADTYINLVNQVCSNQSVDNVSLRNALGSCFRNLMIRDKIFILKATENLIEATCSDASSDSEIFKLIAELHALYPGDPGVFAPFFLNYLKLTPGQAIYLKPNKLHAYLKGECIECMACSDNVVRAGLTTKFRDLKTLIEMLDYQPLNSIQDLLITAAKKVYNDDSTIYYFSPIEEFKLEKIVIQDKQEYVLPAVNSGAFVIILSGSATTEDFFYSKIRHKLSLGFAGFIPPKIAAKLEDVRQTFVMYRAFC